MTTSHFALRTTLTLAGLCLFATISLAQSFSENALLFGRTRPGGSARIQALGGAQVSLGGDFSSALSNPAGLGMYNRSEFSLGLGVNSLDIESSYYGQSSSSQNSKFNIPNLGLVFHHESERASGFLGGSFAITLTRINDLNVDFGYEGRQSESSIIDYFIEDAYFRAPDDPDDMLYGGPGFYNITGLAYNNYLFEGYEDTDGNLQYGSVLSPLLADDETRTLTQRERVQRKGAQYQWSFAYGANFSDKFFVGATLGIATLRYELQQSFEESDLSFFDPSGPIDYEPIRSYRVEESLDIQGTGLNLGLGAIYRPVDFMQVGVSFVTPTLYQVTDTYDARVFSDWNRFDYYGDGSEILEGVSEQFDEPLLSEYNLITPLKVATGVTFISKYGFITADLEFVNYGGSRYSSDTDDVEFDSDNDNIKTTYGSALNYRIGAEYRYNVFRVRAGYNVMGDPFRGNAGVDESVQSISGGVGVKLKKFSADLALISSKGDRERIPYSVSDLPTPVAAQTWKATNAMLTFGFTF